MRAPVFLLILTGLLCLTMTKPVHAEADATFNKANADYAAGHFPDAIMGYESLVKNRQWNPVLFYDLGNAYFRTGDFGRAILNYERALALDPAQPEARANLQLARDQARAIELVPGWTETHLDFLTRDQCAWLAAAAFWGAAAILVRALLRPTTGGRLDFRPGVVRRDFGGRGVCCLSTRDRQCWKRSCDRDEKEHPGTPRDGGERGHGAAPAAGKRGQDPEHAGRLVLRRFA